MATNAEYLRLVKLFEGLEPERLNIFAAACTRRQLTRSEILFFEGEPGAELYVLVSGKVRIEKVSSSGEVQVIAVRGPGEVIGEMALIDEKPRSAQATAQTKVKMLVLSKSNFQKAVLQEPTVTFAIMQTLSHRLRDAADLLLDVRVKDVSERLLDYLIKEADSEGNVRLGITQTALAEQLGCTREAINRALKSLEERSQIRRVNREHLILMHEMQA